ERLLVGQARLGQALRDELLAQSSRHAGHAVAVRQLQPIALRRDKLRSEPQLVDTGCKLHELTVACVVDDGGCEGPCFFAGVEGSRLWSEWNRRARFREVVELNRIDSVDRGACRRYHGR